MSFLHTPVKKVAKDPYSNTPPQEVTVDELSIPKVTVFALGVTILLVLLMIVGSAGCASYNRYQKRANATNAVSVTHIKIQQANQQARINNAQIAATVAEAKKVVAQAQGLAKAQRIIDNTLTPLYVQHEAIQAQERIATSGKNNTVIYVPAGTNGTPIITQDSHGITGATPKP